MSESISWLQEVEDIPKKSADPIGAEVLRRFNGAVSWQSSERVNGKSLRTVLKECWEQQNGILSCEAKERAQALGVDAVINITALKTSIANAYLTDALTSGSSALPWVIQPTPQPDLSDLARNEILQSVKELIFDQMGNLQAGLTSSEMVAIIRQIKSSMIRKTEEKAKKAADAMTLLIEDQCSEGGFHKALIDFLQYFPVYPFAVFSGPYIVRAPRLIWGKNKPRLSTEVFPVFRAISPFDFCYSSDSPDTQRGTCVFTRTQWTRRELLDAAKLSSYLYDNVMDVLKEADTNNKLNLRWLSEPPGDAERNLHLWNSNVSPIEVLTHYGLLSGRELSKYGLHSLDDKEFYNTEVAMVASKVIQIKVMNDPKAQMRPIYTASFYRTGGDRIAGDGIAQRVRDIEKAYHASLMYLMRNAANASAPMCEADYSRISEFINDNDIGKLLPGTMYLSNPSEIGMTNSPAFRFFNIPSNIPAYAQLMEMFMQLADRVTNIPAALHGEAVGSGAMRTFRGMSMLQGNATRAFQAAVANLSNGVFDFLGKQLYNINMLFSKDPMVKGDSQIVTKGAEGLLQEEIEKQTSMEILQVVGAVGAQLGQMLNIAPVVAWSIKKLMGNMKVPDDVINQMAIMPPVMESQTPPPEATQPTEIETTPQEM